MTLIGIVFAGIGACAALGVFVFCTVAATATRPLSDAAEHRGRSRPSFRRAEQLSRDHHSVFVGVPALTFHPDEGDDLDWPGGDPMWN